MTFSLGIPNQEIRQDINTLLLEIMAGGSRITERNQIHETLVWHQFDELEEALKAFYAGLSYGP